MSNYNPPTLQQLALEWLLRNDAIDSSDLDNLPTVLFPPLFLEAFSGRHTQMLKAMVTAWPFPCLPVGPLMKTPDVEILQAVLDGIDILLTQNVVPRRWKLQVLDLTDVHQAFWNVWAGREDGVHSAETGSEMQVAEHIPGKVLRQDLKVVTDLSLCLSLNEYQTYLLQWAQQRKGSLRLCCPKMKIFQLPACIIRELLEVFEPSCINEFELSTNNIVSFLDRFAPYFGKMQYLCKLTLTLINLDWDIISDIVTDKEEKKESTKFLSQFSKLNHLRHLYLNGASFSNDKMKELFRCLRVFLESLSITHCGISESDLEYLSQCNWLCQLKHLHIKHVVLSMSRVTHLRVLLEKVADSLQTLELHHCKMNDSQLGVLLPVLSQCSQLTRINFYDNRFSTPVLKELLQCMANLRKLTEERYPAPLECYDDMDDVMVERFSQLCPELVDILMAKRQVGTIFFATVPHLSLCWMRYVYDRKTTRLCLH